MIDFDKINYNTHSFSRQDFEESFCKLERDVERWRILHDGSIVDLMKANPSFIAYTHNASDEELKTAFFSAQPIIK